jgi:S-DNA-T family DNA segregation ATPase FtsK/SpoIIIE
LELPIGLAADDLEVAALHLPQLDHIFIGGAALTGKSTALAQVAIAWRRANPSGTTVVVDRRRPLTTDRLAERPGAPILVLVDDAERVEDEGGLLAEILAAGDPNVTVAAAARLDAVRSSYGHWARDVARSRCGIILTSAGDVDGDLLGVTLPRRSLIAPRPGLGWLIDSRGQRLIQIAS